MKQLIPAQRVWMKICSIALVSSIIFTQASCYSVRIAAKDATPTKTFSSSGYGYWRDLEVVSIDTTVKVSDFSLYDYCPDGFHTVEYKVSMGHVLLNGITFGKVKKVRIKCNCIKPQN